MAKKAGNSKAAKAKEAKLNENREMAIEGAINQITKEFGKGSIMRLGSDSVNVQVESISTGALELDIALGIGGLPKGRIVEIYGPESSGKTTLMLSAVAQAQKAAGTAAFIDAEHALDPAYAKKLGVNLEDLLVSQPDNGEEALEITEALVRSNAIDIIVIDSVAALTPRAEIEGEMGDSHMGLQARLMSQALRKLTGAISKSKTTVVFINQIRHKIGVMFGSPETTTGGNALKFYASVRLDIRRIETLKKADLAFGTRVRVKVVKNKMAPPFRQAEFEIIFNEGISHEGCVLDAGVREDILERAGTWYSYGEERLGQGRENAKIFLKENPDICEDVHKKVLIAVGILKDEEAEKEAEKQKAAEAKEGDKDSELSEEKAG